MLRLFWVLSWLRPRTAARRLWTMVIVTTVLTGGGVSELSSAVAGALGGAGKAVGVRAADGILDGAEGSLDAARR